jgi:hypothetical protein
MGALHIAVISQNANKHGFFVISGRISEEMERKILINLKKQSQTPRFARKS